MDWLHITLALLTGYFLCLALSKHNRIQYQNTRIVALQELCDLQSKSIHETLVVMKSSLETMHEMRSELKAYRRITHETN